VLPRRKDRGWGFRAAWIVLIFITALAIGDAVSAPTPISRQPDFIDTILASRAVVAAIRLAIIFAAIFVILSVVALIARRQWLARVGPVEVEKVSDLSLENQQLEQKLDEAHRAIESLKRNVAYTHRVIDRERNI
jgi:hypothetical protein